MFRPATCASEASSTWRRRRGCRLHERQKRGLPSARRGKEQKSSLSPLLTVCLSPYLSLESASPAECRLVEGVLGASFLDELPARLIGDKAYDSDPVDAHLKAEYGVELIAPNRRGHKRRTQYGRPLRRYRRRWKMEHLFAWLHDFRRLVIRWERRVGNFVDFVPARLPQNNAEVFMRPFPDFKAKIDAASLQKYTILPRT